MEKHLKAVSDKDIITLKFTDGQWYIIKDHASSSEKGEIYTK